MTIAWLQQETMRSTAVLLKTGGQDQWQETNREQLMVMMSHIIPELHNLSYFEIMYYEHYDEFIE